MAISKKGSRRIRIDNHEYRWKVSKNGVLHMVAFREEEGKVIKVVVNYPRGVNKKVTPREVKRFILLAIKDGLSYENNCVVYSAEVG